LRYLRRTGHSLSRVGGRGIKTVAKILANHERARKCALLAHDNVPHLVTAQLEKAPKTPRLFDR